VSNRPAPKYDEPTDVSIVRTAISALLVVAGIAWVVVYAVKGIDEPPKIQWMYDLEDWNWLIGFGMVMVGLVFAANKATPLGRGRGVVVGMLGCFLLGLAWIVIYYFTANDADFPLFSDLGQYNLVVGIALMATGFVYATKWE